jgi:hypothetical protein
MYSAKAEKPPNSTIAEELGFNADNEALQEAVPITGQHYGSVEPHVFSSSIRAQHWKSVYENVKYEGRHRFDPSFQWSARSEVLLKKKVITFSYSFLYSSVLAHIYVIFHYVY